MGYHKNELIAQQVEVGDRIPEPMPWYSHASLSRKSIRARQKELKLMSRRQLAADLLTYGLGMFTVAMMWILVEVFS